MRMGTEIQNKVRMVYQNMYYGEIREGMTFAELLEVYKKCRIEVMGTSSETTKRIYKQKIDSMVVAIIPTGAIVDEVTTEMVYRMLINVRTNKVTYLTVRGRLKDILDAIMLYNTVTEKSVMIAENARFYYDMIPEDRKRQEDGKQKKKRRVIKGENSRNKDKECNSNNGNNIEIIGYYTTPVFKDLKCGECFLLHDKSESYLYMKMNPIYCDGVCVGNAVRLNDGKVFSVCGLVNVVKAKIDIKADIKR